MVPGRELQQSRTEPEVTATQGSVCLNSPEKPLPEAGLVYEGNAIDLIRSQPVPAPVPTTEELPGPPSKPTCAQCGLQIAASRDLKGPPRGPPKGPQCSSVSLHSANSRRSKTKEGSVATLNRPAIVSPGDWCVDLLLSCLFCHCSALLLGLLDLCSSVCSCCAEGCTHCCSLVQDVPVEELSCHTHCHSVLVQSCCEPTECLEFCLECCQICHRS